MESSIENLESVINKLNIKPTLTRREPVQLLIKKETTIKGFLDGDNDLPLDYDDDENEVDNITSEKAPIIIYKDEDIFDGDIDLIMNKVDTYRQHRHYSNDYKQPNISIDNKDGANEEAKQETKQEAKQEAKQDDDVNIKIKGKKATPRITKKIKRVAKIERGVADFNPDYNIIIKDEDIINRIKPQGKSLERQTRENENEFRIATSKYFMENRNRFVSFINTQFSDLKDEMNSAVNEIDCDSIGNQSGTDFDLLMHQQIVKDYLNLYTPYRGLLIYHGLGSGKTCTSIAVAEGMKHSRKVFILTPASLQTNYREELKKCGDLLYKRNKFWEWISIKEYPEALEPMSAILNLSVDYINKQKGAWFINYKKESNYDTISQSESQKMSLETQLDEMINTKYEFINYNGLRLGSLRTGKRNKNTKKTLNDLTNNFTMNPFDNAVVVIDEAHNLISRIINKLKVEKDDPSIKIGDPDYMPRNLAIKLYHYLMIAKNVKLVLLTGTPLINYPNEFAILFNILRGYIKTWTIPLTIDPSKSGAIDLKKIKNILSSEKTHDYVDYSSSTSILTITRNPYGFKNIVKKDKNTNEIIYKGINNNKINEDGNVSFHDDYISDELFQDLIISVLKKKQIQVNKRNISIDYIKSLPDTLDRFKDFYIDSENGNILNKNALKKRIMGLSSYFRSAQENLLPNFEKKIGIDYHIVQIDMSDYQFKKYEEERKKEREKMKQQNKKRKQNIIGDVYNNINSSSTYRISSRLLCNYVVPERPMPPIFKKKNDETNQTKDELKMIEGIEKELINDTEREGEVEGDEILENMGGVEYKEQLRLKIIEMRENAEDYFSREALQSHSPKFLNILENILDDEYEGLHLLYSQFRSVEGIALFCEILDFNGFAQFKLNKNTEGIWSVENKPEDIGKKRYALYTGTETTEEKEIIRRIYNGEWDKKVPSNIVSELNKISNNNNYGEIIKLLMITSSGSEGINLRNTRYVHIMEPYWHPVRTEQVIGRARRICSHKSLPKQLQTVEVFIYLMKFSEEQLRSDEARELKLQDLSKLNKTPITSDEYLFEISEIKANVTKQLTDIIKESAFDCHIYQNGNCINFTNLEPDRISYVPKYEQQPADEIEEKNQVQIKLSMKPININGIDYVYDKKTRNVYDKDSYNKALENKTLGLVTNDLLQIGQLQQVQGKTKFIKI